MLNFFVRSGAKIEKIDSLGPGEGLKPQRASYAKLSFSRVLKKGLILKIRL